MDLVKEKYKIWNNQYLSRCLSHNLKQITTKTKNIIHSFVDNQIDRVFCSQIHTCP
jgi:hypothetical protein